MRLLQAKQCQRGWQTARSWGRLWNRGTGQAHPWILDVGPSELGKIDLWCEVPVSQPHEEAGTGQTTPETHSNRADCDPITVSMAVACRARRAPARQA